MKCLKSVLFAAAMLAPATAHASLLLNGSFASTCGSGSFCTYSAGNSTDIPNWLVINGGNPTDSNGSVDLITGYWQQPPGGGNSVDLDGNAYAGLSQTFATEVGRSYTVTFYLSGNPDGAPATKDLGVDFGGVPLTFSYTVTGNRNDMDWLAETFTFIATSVSTTLSFTSLDSPSTSAGFFGPVIGNVDVEATPEPTGIAMIGVAMMALFGLGAIRRRQAVC